MIGISEGEVAKETFEDLATLVMCLRRGHEGDRALEATLNRVLRALANPQGHTREGVLQGISRFMNIRYPLRPVEGNED